MSDQNAILDFLTGPENLEVAEGIGRTFAAGDAEDLARELGGMLAMGEEERMERGMLGRGRVESEYTWERVTDGLEELYRSLLA